MGTEFQLSVQALLNQHVDTRKSLLEKQKSKFNQASIKEVKVGIIGQGQSFGDIDVLRKRKYMYTLRTLSSDCQAYEISVKDFNHHLCIVNKEN